MTSAPRPTAFSLLEALEALCGAPVHMVSTGPDRKENIILHHPMVVENDVLFPVGAG